MCVCVCVSPLQGWCTDNFIHSRNMRTVLDIRRQLRELCQREEVRLTSSLNTEPIMRALLSGLFTNLAEHVGEGRYQTVSLQPLPFSSSSSIATTQPLQVSSHQLVYIHPSSCLFHHHPPPACLMFSELVHTSKCYMR